MAGQDDGNGSDLLRLSDLRGKKVFALNDEEIGSVEELYVDKDGLTPRYLEARAGSSPGAGERSFLIPIQAIGEISGERVVLNQRREKVFDSPEYVPGYIPGAQEQRDISGHYDFPPVIPPG